MDNDVRVYVDEEVPDKANGTKMLALLSGGLDSTAMLYHLLMQTCQDVHVHHVCISRGGSQKHIAEWECVQKIVPWFRKNTRHFEFTYSTFGLPGVHAPIDHYIYLMMAALMTMTERTPIEWENHVRAVALGRIRTDNTMRGMKNFVRARKFFRAATYNNVQLVAPLDYTCKRDIIQAIPSELINMTMTCWHPIKEDGGWTYCGKCNGCGRRAEGLHQSRILNENKEYDYYDYKYIPELTDYVGPNGGVY